MGSQKRGITLYGSRGFGRLDAGIKRKGADQMIEVKVTVIPQCSDGDIKHWIQFFSEIENVEKAPHQAMQNDILFYLNALKYFKDKSEEMQKSMQEALIHINDGDYRAAETELNKAMEG